MSEKVQALARDVYAEFEKLMIKYDEKVVEDLMPLVVNVLEALENTHVEKEEHKAEVEVLREDNEQLLVQYDREKQLRKQLDRKNIETEDGFEEEKRKQQEKAESLEAIVRMLELKSKNASDQVLRLEEKERETRRDYERMHDKYSQLFKTHVEHLDRTRFLLGASTFDESLPVKSRSLTQTISGSGDGSLPDINMDDDNAEMLLIQRGQSLLTSLEEQDRLRPLNAARRSAHQTFDRAVLRPAVNRGVSSYSEAEMSMEPDDCDIQERDEKRADVYSEADESEGGQNEDALSITDRGQSDSNVANGRLGFPFAISREVEELIRENNDLLATKNALNVVKDDLIAQVDELVSERDMLKDESKSLQDVKNKLKERIAFLEDNMRRMREGYELKLSEVSNEEDAIPYAQQKRFTRMEMARMVQEKNKYKEQLMELQDEVRAKVHSSLQRASIPAPRNRSSLWKFFNQIFGNGRSRESVRLAGDANGTVSPSHSTASKSPPLLPAESSDNLQVVNFHENAGSWSTSSDLTSGATPLKPSSRPVAADRIQAYGWSIPKPYATTTSVPSVQIPTPIYCRPLLEKDPDMKIWCAVGFKLPARASLAAGPTSTGPVLEGFEESRVDPYANASSCIWICSSTHSAGKVSVIDANRPNDVLESFTVCSSHLLCLAHVPGFDESSQRQKSDSADDAEASSRERALASVHVQGGVSHPLLSGMDLGSVVFVSCATGQSSSLSGSGKSSRSSTGATSGAQGSTKEETTAENAPADSETADPRNDFIPRDSDLGRARLGSTVWIGSQKGGLYLYHASREYRRRIAKVLLADAVLCIIHTGDRAMASLADGSVAVFHRSLGGWWDTKNYHLLSLGQTDHAIRSMVVVTGPIRSPDWHVKDDSPVSVWTGCRNKIHIIEPLTLKIKASFEAHSRQDSAVRQMVCVGQGVWISIRLDNTLRLFHAETLQHLMDLPVEPLSSLTTGKGRLGISLVRITAMASSGVRLWIGTSTGVVLSIPFSSSTDGGKIEGRVQPQFLPVCDANSAQISYHGHKEEVKFFVSVPGVFTSSPTTDGRKASGAASSPSRQAKTVTAAARASESTTLLVSGGEGYVDFRYDDSAEEDTDNPSSRTATGGDSLSNSSSKPSQSSYSSSAHRNDRSHLIVWQVPTSST